MFAWPLPPTLSIHGVLRSRYISSPFGSRINPVTKQPQKHGGLDLPVEVGTAVRAIAAGTVGTTKLDHPIAGNYVEVDHGNGYWSRYLHLSRINVASGKSLPAGGTLGLSGGGKGVPGAGRSTGPHLHLEVWRGKPYSKGSTPVDPLPLLTTELLDLVKEATTTAYRAGRRTARTGVDALRRNWWIAGIGAAGLGAVLWFALRRPKAPKKNPRGRRR